MNPIKAILKRFCSIKKMRGALVITKDGLIIENHLESDAKAETLGAFMSQVAQTINNSLIVMNEESWVRYTLESNHERVYIENLGKSLLIALSEIDVDTGKINIALFQAANEIKKTGRIV
ncbi:MAG: roadblock/LC7 domain-containing protein [Nitrospinota bacterium]